VTEPHHLFVCSPCRASGEVREPKDGRSGYRHAKVGFLAREERPLPLRAGVLARIPPLELL